MEKEKVCKGYPSIPFAKAESRLADKVSASYPDIARKTGFEGDVVVEACVAESGEVQRAVFVSGHPFLLVEAIKAVKQWKFQPGDAFRTNVTLSFSLGSSKAEIAAVEKTNRKYFVAQDTCRQTYALKKLDAAARECQAAVELVNQLPPGRKNERRIIHGLLSRIYFDQRKYPLSLAEAKKELEIGLDSLPPEAAELAYAYHDVALANHALRDVSSAVEHYTKAAQTMSDAIEKLPIEGLKANYTATLRTILSNFLVLIKQLKQDGLAKELEKRLEAIR